MTRRRSDQVCSTASRELRDALDAEAFANDESRTAAIRNILVDCLRQAWSLVSRAAPADRLGQHKPRYKQNAK